MKDTKRNLCDACKFNIPECQALNTDIEFGDGLGNDNVIECKFYEVREEIKMSEQILATVTDEEAEQFQKIKNDTAKVIELTEEAEKLSAEIQKQKQIWFLEIQKKYNITNPCVHFDIETKTITDRNRTTREHAFSELIKILEVLKDE